MSEKKIVKANSEGNKYNYASLSDIVNQDYQIPKMKVETDSQTMKDYVAYYDEDLKEWIRGAEIVIPEVILNKDGKDVQNSAQRYGSALTYARRYTAFLALSLASEDDKDIESSVASESQVSYIKVLYDLENQKKIMEYYKIKDLSELSRTQAHEVIEKAKQRNKERNNNAK